jgi:tripartite-type tricarboxylate transporter receptor subunit TctC
VRQQSAREGILKNVLVLLSMLVAVALAPAAHADQYPSRPITIIVPLTAGTTVDVLARIYADAVSKRLGQPVVIANKPGAGGMIAAQTTATAAPDGYTIQMANSGHVIAGLMAKNLSFDAVADFAGIAMVGEAPAVVAITPKLNVKNLQEFVAVAKSKPGVLNYGSGGVGSATHLAGAVFLAKAGIDVVHVPYKTATDLLSDLVTGRIDATFSPTAFVGPLVKDGKIQAVAIGADEPQTDPFPAPTARSAGVDYLYSTWYGFLAPAKTPQDVLEKLGAAFIAAAADPEVGAKVRSQGIAPKVKTRAAFDAHIREDTKTLAPVIERIARDTR